MSPALGAVASVMKAFGGLGRNLRFARAQREAEREPWNEKRSTA
jgi:hypothetical protein